MAKAVSDWSVCGSSQACARATTFGGSPERISSFNSTSLNSRSSFAEVSTIGRLAANASNFVASVWSPSLLNSTLRNGRSAFGPSTPTTLRFIDPGRAMIRAKSATLSICTRGSANSFLTQACIRRKRSYQ